MNQGEEIRDKAFIFSLLKRVQNKRTLLAAQVADSKVDYTTSILSISNENPPYLVLDELNDPKGHARFVERGKMTVKGQLDGLELSFECELLHVDQQEVIAKYYVAFPSSVLYKQQRESFRIHLGPDMQFPVRLYYSETGQTSGSVIDISQTGMGLVFDQFIDFQPGDFINDCVLLLPHNEQLKCKVIIRHSTWDEASNSTHLGVEMLSLLNQERRDYLRAVANIQREMVRRQARVS